MSTLVRLVRHAEVAAPHQGRLYGDADVPLSADGRAASRTLARQLAAEGADRVWSSPLSRALVLAEAVAQAAGAPLVVEPDLRELHRGSWAHHSREELEAASPGALARYAADLEHGNAPDGERESQLRARVDAALARLLAAGAGGRVVVVTHAHVIRVVMRRLLGWSAQDSLGRFVPYLGVVDVALEPDGRGAVLAAPPGILGHPLRQP